MTDTSSFAATHPVPQPLPVTTSSLPSPLVNGSLSDTNGQDEEDYTIKCICAYTDDDGNTVLCEKCDTWQHIECYYHGKTVPDEHFCSDCRPRELDGRRATERQRRVREQIPGGDRKIKRPSSKGQKRRTKENGQNGEQTNGWHNHERHDSVMSNRDQPPPQKKAKTAHRNSGSIASLNGTPNFAESRKRATSNVQSYPSPSKSPQDLYQFPAVPKYTTEFLELYERDEGRFNVTSDAKNLYDHQAMSKIKAWHADPQALAAENGRPNTEPPFIETEETFSPNLYPQVELKLTTGKEEWNGKIPTWQYLRLEEEVSKNALVGEIAGEVGLLQEYSLPGQSNRWQELHHPDPFVFFHQHMNIYIDSRKFGTKLRYLRRSCQPNLTLKTYVSRDGEYHHCFVASRDISAGSELTASWHYPIGRFQDENDDADERQRKRIEWVSHLLANFGDCACDRNTQPCLMAPADRRYTSKHLDPTKQANGRKRKNKTKHAISPLSTGQATNSRAGSEAAKGLEDDDQSDRRSTSGSTGSGHGSRDDTPTNHVGLLDAEPVLGPGLSARERKKIEAQEKAFKRLEKEQHEKKKTRKRTSAGSNLTTPNASGPYQSGPDFNGYPVTPVASNYVSRSDGRLQQLSGSPPPSRFPDIKQRSAQLPCTATDTTENAVKRDSYTRPKYVDAWVQTDPEESDEIETPPRKRRKYLTPTQRLLRRVYEDRLRYQKQREGTSPGTLSGPASPIDIRAQSPLTQRTDQDVEMTDVSLSAKSSSAGSPVMSRSGLPSPSIGGPNSSPLPLPSQAAHSQPTYALPGSRRLQLNTLPPVPTFPTENGNVANTPATSTPASGTSMTAQSPFSFGGGSSSYPGLSSGIVTPSPVKKKLSLADYKNRRSTIASTPVIEKSETTFVEEKATPERVTLLEERSAFSGSAFMIKPNESIKEEALAAGGMEGSAVEDVPMKDEPPPEAPNSQQLLASAPAAAPQPDLKTTYNTAPPASTQTSTHIDPNTVAPEVRNVLAVLEAMRQHQSPHQI